MEILIPILRFAGLMCVLTSATYWTLRLYDTLSPNAFMSLIGAVGVMFIIVATVVAYFWGDPDQE